MARKRRLYEIQLTSEDVKAAYREAGPCVLNRMVPLSLKQRQQSRKDTFRVLWGLLVLNCQPGTPEMNQREAESYLSQKQVRTVKQWL